jgi:hypothetical protein
MTELAKEELAAARATASQIRQGIHNYLATLALIGRAWKQEHWRVLGYKSWAEYVDGEFGEERLKLPTEHRRKAVEELRLLGMSQRAIGTALDVPQSTVRDDLQVSGSTHLEETKGTDGKTYAASRPSSPSGDGEADARPVDDSHSDDEAPIDATSVGAGETAIEGPGVSPSVDADGEGTTTDPDGADAAGDPTDRPSAGSPVNPLAADIAAAKQEARTSPSYVAQKAIEELKVFRDIVNKRCGGVDSIVEDLLSDDLGRGIASLWLTEIEQTSELLDAWRGGLRRLRLRSVQ